MYIMNIMSHARKSSVCNPTSESVISTITQFPSSILFYLLHPNLVHCNFNEVIDLIKNI